MLHELQLLPDICRTSRTLLNRTDRLCIMATISKRPHSTVWQWILCHTPHTSIHVNKQVTVDQCITSTLHQNTLQMCTDNYSKSFLYIQFLLKTQFILLVVTDISRLISLAFTSWNFCNTIYFLAVTASVGWLGTVTTSQPITCKLISSFNS